METGNGLEVNNRNFSSGEKKHIEDIVRKLHLDRGTVERGDFLATLRSDVERISKAKQFKFDKMKAATGHVSNRRDDLQDNSVAQFHIDAISEITEQIKTGSRSELKNNMARINQLSSFLEKSDIEDKKFLQNKYSQALKFVEVEHAKKSQISNVIGTKIADMADDFINIQSVYQGTFGNNPAAMFAGRFISKSYNDYKSSKKAKDDQLSTDAESVIVNTRNERVKETNKLRDRNMEAKLKRIRNDNSGNDDDDAILGSFGSNSPSNKVTTDSQTSAGQLNTVSNSSNVSEMVSTNIEQNEKQVDLLSKIQLDISDIKDVLIKSNKSDLSEELQKKSITRNRAKPIGAKDESNNGDSGDDGGSLLDMLGDGVGGRRNRRRSGRKGRIGKRKNRMKGLGGSPRRKGGKLGKLFKAGKGLLGVGVATGAGFLGMGGASKVSSGVNFMGMGSGAGKTAGKTAGNVSKVADMSAMGKFAGKGSSKGLAKAGGKGIAKGIGKSILKKIPGLGLIIGLAAAASRASTGDFGGAGLEALSGLASTVPGLGTAASVAIDAGLMAKDSGAFDGDTPTVEPSTIPEPTTPVNEPVKLPTPKKTPPFEPFKFDDNPSGISHEDAFRGTEYFDESKVDNKQTVTANNSQPILSTPTVVKTTDELAKSSEKNEESKLQVSQLGVMALMLNELKLSNLIQSKDSSNNNISPKRKRESLAGGGGSDRGGGGSDRNRNRSGSSNRGGGGSDRNRNRSGSSDRGGGGTTRSRNRGVGSNRSGGSSGILDRELSKFNKPIRKSTGLYGKAINDPNYELGALTRISETGRLDGSGTISTGRGDFGGKSYGSNQLSSKTGTLQKYLAQSQYGSNFEGVDVASKEFDNIWKDLAAKDKNFGKDQNEFIDATHFTPFMEKIQESGVNVDNRSNGVKEILHSTANQFGANTSIFKKFTENAGGVDTVNELSDSELIEQFSDYKKNNVGKYFKSSSSGVRAGVSKRFERERTAALGLDAIQNKTEIAGVIEPVINDKQSNVLEEKTDTMREKIASAENKPPVILASNSTSNSGGGGVNQGNNESSYGLISRNLDTTITRLSDRFISDSSS